LNRTSRRKPNFRRWWLLASWHSGQGCQTTACRRVAFHQQQRETCTQHNQELCSQLRWGCQSHRFAVNKGLSVSSGKRIIVCNNINRASNSKTVKQCKGNWTRVHSSLVESLYKINNNMLGKQITVGQLIE
jgi:hypothetical protein